MFLGTSHGVRTVVFAGVAVLLASPLTSGKTPVGEQTFEFRYQFNTNQFIHYQSDHQVTMVTEYGEAKLTTFNRTKERKHYRVASVDKKGNATLELVIDHVRMQAKSGDDKPVIFDSADEETHALRFRDVLKTVGRPHARMKFSPTGKVLSTRMLISIPNGGAVDQDDALRNFLVVFPQKKLAVGDKWEDRIEVPVKVGKKLTRNVAMLRSYKLLKVDGTRATIELKTGILSPTRDGFVRGQLIQRAPRGTVVFDLERGLIVERNLKTDKTEVGVFQNQGSLRAISNRVERIFDPDVAEADKTKTKS